MTRKVEGGGAKLVVMAKPMVPESEAVGFVGFPFSGTSTHLKWKIVVRQHFAC